MPNAEMKFSDQINRGLLLKVLWLEGQKGYIIVTNITKKNKIEKKKNILNIHLKACETNMATRCAEILSMIVL